MENKVRQNAECGGRYIVPRITEQELITELLTVSIEQIDSETEYSWENVL